MVPTVFPNNVDYMAITMEEKARIRDKMPLAALNFAIETRFSYTTDDAEVSFRISAAKGTRF
jgi:hypothetical protein